MRKSLVVIIAALLSVATAPPSASGYMPDTTLPQNGGCPQLDRWNLSPGAPLSRQWSTSLPARQTIITAATSGPLQLAEINQLISDSFGVWTGVAGTTFSATNHPGFIGPLNQITAANACSDDLENNLDGVNTICFNQSSAGFTTGVLAFTRIITANAPGVSVGSSGAAAFAGQILDADTLFRNDGQATFATPATLGTPAAPGGYDLESLLTHELGHWFGLDHSAVWRASMFPFAPPPGQFVGDRSTPSAPDGPLSDDDRTGIRVLYPDPADTVNIGSILGQVMPANSFSLATLAPTSSGRYVTGIFGAHVVAVDADTGAVIAGTIGGWSCDASNPPAQFNGSFDLERLPVNHNYNLYAEPLDGLVIPSDFSTAIGEICSSNGVTVCTVPPVNAAFNGTYLPGSP